MGKSNYSPSVWEIYLKRNKMTQAEFAKEIGVSQGTLHNYIHGVYEPTSSILRKSSELLGIKDPSFLLEDFDKNKNYE